MLECEVIGGSSSSCSCPLYFVLNFLLHYMQILVIAMFKIFDDMKYEDKNRKRELKIIS